MFLISREYKRIFEEIKKRGVAVILLTAQIVLFFPKTRQIVHFTAPALIQTMPKGHSTNITQYVAIMKFLASGLFIP